MSLYPLMFKYAFLKRKGILLQYMATEPLANSRNIILIPHFYLSYCPQSSLINCPHYVYYRNFFSPCPESSALYSTVPFFLSPLSGTVHHLSLSFTTLTVFKKPRLLGYLMFPHNLIQALHLGAGI